MTESIIGKQIEQFLADRQAAGITDPLHPKALAELQAYMETFRIPSIESFSALQAIEYRKHFAARGGSDRGFERRRPTLSEFFCWAKHLGLIEEDWSQLMELGE